MRPIERPSKSVSCQTVPPSAGVTITSMVNLEPVRRANKPLQQPMGELPSSAAAAFAVLEGLALDRPAIERRALNADMCDYIEWSKRKVEGQRREKKRQPLSTVGTRKAERRSWRGLYPMKPAICAMWS